MEADMSDIEPASVPTAAMPVEEKAADHSPPMNTVPMTRRVPANELKIAFISDDFDAVDDEIAESFCT